MATRKITVDGKVFHIDPEAVIQSLGGDPSEGKIDTVEVRYAPSEGKEYLMIKLNCGRGGLKKWKLRIADLEAMFGE